MSHLHYDHSGGMVWEKDGKLEVSFPNAEYFIQRGEWEVAYSKPSKSYRTDIFDVLQRSGQVVFLDGDGKINEEISYEKPEVIFGKLESIEAEIQSGLADLKELM